MNQINLIHYPMMKPSFGFYYLLLLFRLLTMIQTALQQTPLLQAASVVRLKNNRDLCKSESIIDAALPAPAPAHYIAAGVLSQV